MSGQGLDGHIIFHHALNLAASLGTRGLLEGSWRGFEGILEGSWRGLEGSLRAQTIICPPRVWADTHTHTHTHIYGRTPHHDHHFRPFGALALPGSD